LDFCGLDDIDCDGLSLKPLLTGKSGQKCRDFVIGEYYGKQQWVNPIRMLETRDYKYNQYIEHGNELYDLQNDPHELQNVVHESDYQGEKENMKRLLDTWIKENKDPFYSLKTTELDPKTVLKSLTKKNKL
jgi:arylsulfatase A-like enzyme